MLVQNLLIIAILALKSTPSTLYYSKQNSIKWIFNNYLFPMQFTTVNQNNNSTSKYIKKYFSK
jgi:hypothetical protein